jgi:hypothetical protein
LASALNSLTGEPLVVGTSDSRPREVFSSASLPIDARVPDKLKAKIWAHEYFEFGQLISTMPSDETFSISLQKTSLVHLRCA